jgi:hypothetical protein
MRFFVFGLVVASLVVACKAKPPKPGEACTSEGQATCVDKTTRVVCKDGKNVVQKCTVCQQTKSRGLASTSETSFVGGCVASGIGPEGSPCDGESVDCDGKTLVKCIAGQYRHFPCGGANGCTHDLEGVSCDSTIGAPGDACREGSVACTADKGGMLHCKQGVYVRDKSCRGPKGCAVDPKNEEGKVMLSCDSTLAVLGEPCIDGGSCSADKQSILTCEKGKYAVFRRCRGTVAECKYDEKDKSFECAESGVGEVGDPCDGGGACASDGKALLECKSGVLAVRSRCRTCKIKGDRADCKF